MIIGILGFQGGVTEHIYILRKVFRKLDISGDVRIVRNIDDLNDIDGIIIPGGESTTIGALARRMGIIDKLRKIILDGLPVLGVCAGAIMLSKNVLDRIVDEVKQPLLSVMDVEVVRNYFGRQRESFEIDLDIPILGEKPYRGVFIRAPAIIKIATYVEPLAKLEDIIVLARQNSMIASVFHPELTNDTRIHELFVDTIKR